MNKNEKQGLNTEEEIPLKTSTRPIILVAFFVLILGFGTFLAWAFFAPLDEGVVAPGVVTVASNRKTIQHQYGGTIQKILVVEGDRVKKEQLLVRLNDAQAKANLTNIRNEYFLALALEARLLTERKREAMIGFPKEITSLGHLPELANLIKTQQEIFNARRGSLENEINILKGNIGAMEEYIRRLEELQSSRLKQMELLTGEMNSLREMAEQGYYPRTKIIEMERMLAELSGKRSEDLGNIARARKTVSEYKIRIVRLEHEFLKEVETHLSEIQKKLAALKDQYDATQDVLKKTEIKAPEDGFIVGLHVHTIGGVVMAGQPIMDIVPVNEELIVEAKVMTTDIDRLHLKLKADLRFIAFDAKKTPVVEGEVILISADRFIDEATKIPYYLCRIRLTEDGIQQLGNRHLQPGMPVQVIIKMGQRTLMEYLIKPLFDRLAISFKEK